jgi:hypothetical protein
MTLEQFMRFPTLDQKREQKLPRETMYRPNVPGIYKLLRKEPRKTKSLYTITTILDVEIVPDKEFHRSISRQG